MRNTILGLLLAILILTVVNLLSSFGIIGGASGGGHSSAHSGHEFKVMNSAMMDQVGYLAVAAEEGIEVPEDGKITFPKAIREKIFKVNLLPKTIMEVEKRRWLGICRCYH